MAKAKYMQSLWCVSEILPLVADEMQTQFSKLR